MNNIKERVLKQIPLNQIHLFWKSKKGRGWAKGKFLPNRIMITPEEDLSSRRKVWSAFIVRKWVTSKGSVDCGKENRRKKNGDAKKNDKENTAAIIDGDLGNVYDESSVNLTCHTTDWVTDSGASFYVTAHCDYFTFYVNDDYSNIRMENNGASKIVGIGDICLETSIGYNLLLKILDMYHIFASIWSLQANLMMMFISTNLVKENGSSPKAPHY